MSHSTTSDRGSRIWRRQTHDSRWPPVPRLRRNIARGRQPPAVRVELVAARPAALELGDEEIDQPLRLAQLGRRHPVELAVAEDLARE